MMKVKLVYKVAGVLAAVTVATALSAGAQTTPEQPAVPPVTAPATMPDAAPAAADANAAKAFMREAFLANEFGIAASQVAVAQAKSPDVKAAAQKILAASLKTRDGMVTAIQGSTSDMHFDQSWSPDYTAKLADLKATTGPEFDAKYVATQGEVTQKSEAVFKAYAASGTDEAVKTFAANTLPVLQANGDTLDSVAQGGN